MKIPLQKMHNGFTLIEVIIYLALFAVLFAGLVAAAYSLAESSGRGQTFANIAQEGNFVTAKINWALSGTQTINLPAAGGSGSTLSVNRWSDPAENPVVISLDGGNVSISLDNSPAQILNNSSVEVSDLVFTHQIAAAPGLAPENLQASFTLSARTPAGALISQNFSIVNYLKK